ncbi:hypothetical protein AQJ11_34050 [Streptomyces corchorusii]|uniref:Uncharacterized protein n=2 Tax=Streptomyces TaxID=1883 RepID=A0A101PVG7_STRCK|nr:hypothetical protein [Streptomyces corchorusii]KUN18473.1 hypothetical protein AQJ11_34050 [Streptomyces corchorusii]
MGSTRWPASTDTAARAPSHFTFAAPPADRAGSGTGAASIGSGSVHVRNKDQQTIARLRAEKENLTRHPHTHEDHIRRLTLEKEALRVALRADSGVNPTSPRTGDTAPGHP